MIEVLRIPVGLKPFRALLPQVDTIASRKVMFGEESPFYPENGGMTAFFDGDISHFPEIYRDNIEIYPLPSCVKELMRTLKSGYKLSFNIGFLEMINDSKKVSMRPHHNRWISDIVWLDIQGSAPFEWYLTKEELIQLFEKYFSKKASHIYKELFQSEMTRNNGSHFGGGTLDELLEIVEDSNFLYYYGDGRTKVKSSEEIYDTPFDKEYIGGFLNGKTLFQRYAIQSQPFRAGQICRFDSGKYLHNVGTSLYSKDSTYRLYLGYTKPR